VSTEWIVWVWSTKYVVHKTCGYYNRFAYDVRHLMGSEEKRRY